MTSSILSVSQARLEVLVADYQREVGRRRRQSLLVLAILAILIVVAGRFGEVDLKNLIDNISNFTSYFGRILPKLSVAHFGADVADWYWNITGWLKLLLDTVLIAYLGTLIGAGGAFMMAFLAAANLAPSNVLRWSIKRIFEFCRTVPDLVFALMFVSAFGLGPLAGILAIAIHSFGTLGKLFTEAIENIDMKPVEGVRSHRQPLRRNRAVRRAAAGDVDFRQLHAAALRDQRPLGLGGRHGGRRRDRAGSVRGDPQILLHRRQRHPVDDHRLRCDHRSRDRADPASVVRPGYRPMTPLRTMRPDDASAVLDRHRGLFDDSPRQRASALAAPLGFAGFTVFAVWWLDIPFSQIGPGWRRSRNSSR